MDWLTRIVTESLDIVTESLSEPVDRAIVAPGREVAWDDCCDGMAWVRVVNMLPRFSSTETQRQVPCAQIGWDIELGIGVLRCVAVLDDDGNAPYPDQITSDGLSVIRDAFELRSLDLTEIKGVLTSRIRRWDPLGPEGGCAGGEFSINVFTGCI